MCLGMPDAYLGLSKLSVTVFFCRKLSLSFSAALYCLWFLIQEPSFAHVGTGVVIIQSCLYNHIVESPWVQHPCNV